MTEAWHARPLAIDGSGARPSRPLEPFGAPAFPRSRTELEALDAAFGLRIGDTLGDAVAAMVRFGEARRQAEAVRHQVLAVLRGRYEAVLTEQPGLEPAAAVAAVLRQFSGSTPGPRRSTTEPVADEQRQRALQ